MTSQDPDDILSKIVQHLGSAQTYLSKATALLGKYQEEVVPAPLLGSARGTNTAIRSLQVWAEYLAEHGPTPRGVIDAATLTLTNAGYNRTHAWVAPMTYMQDDAFPEDAVFRIRGLKNGVGAPPVIYFLWSSRWDVLPKFGVGPIKPHNMPEPMATDEWAEPAEEPEPDGPVRIATIEEWDQAHAALFDTKAATESKLTDEEKQMLRDTAPEGADANAAIAIAYRAAIERSRAPSPMLGVIAPPISSHPIDPAYGVEQTLHWNDPGPPVDG